MGSYNVTYTREGNNWLGRCDEVQANTFAKTIAGVRKSMIEAVAVSIEEEEDFDLVESIDWADKDLNRAFTSLQKARAKYEEAQQDLEEHNRAAIQGWGALVGVTVGLRDLAEGLGVSLSRAQQLAAQNTERQTLNA